MNVKTFYTQLLKIGFLCILLSTSFYFSTALGSHLNISILFFVAFNLFVIVSYHLACKVIQSEDKNNYSSLIIALIGAKFLVCVPMVVGYAKIYEPTDSYYLIPFLVLYIIYSIFEFRILSTIGYQK